MTKEVITTQNAPNATKVYILIDGSYYCFYRYFALNNWWKNAKADTELGDDPYENTEFRDKYKKVFVDKIQEMATKLKIKKTYGKKVEPIIIVGKDCPRKDIWRMELDNRYKINRIYDSNFKGGNFFKMAYDNGKDNITDNDSNNDDNNDTNNLFIKAGVKAIVSHPRLEADDCLAIAAKQILSKNPEAYIYIITSDTDYLQLLEYPQIELYNLSYKKVSDSKTYHDDPKKYLFMKILMGDKSDDIPGVFSKCGPKTAEKCWENKEYFEEKLQKENNTTERYERNRRLIDFNYIPNDYKNDFIEIINKEIT